jgi:hypothetical protein
VNRTLVARVAKVANRMVAREVAKARTAESRTAESRTAESRTLVVRVVTKVVKEATNNKPVKAVKAKVNREKMAALVLVRARTVNRVANRVATKTVDKAVSKMVLVKVASKAVKAVSRVVKPRLVESRTAFKARVARSASVGMTSVVSLLLSFLLLFSPNRRNTNPTTNRHPNPQPRPLPHPPHLLLL